MKQPQLGQTILEQRQIKKLTQEELVSQCNISVRTLQRIEAGEVTPRDFTIKALLSALEFDIHLIEKSIDNKSSLKKLQLAWIAGLAYFVLGIFETIVDFERFESDLPFYFPLIYTFVKTASAVSFGLFMFGFVEMGKRFESPLLQICAYLMMGSLFIMELHDVLTIMSNISSEEFLLVKGLEGVAFGGIDIIFGVALLRLGRKLGTASTLAGLFEILVGLCFITLVLALAGLLLMIPATILEIVLLYKVFEILKADS